jgi:hypothetical protein
LEEKHPTGIGRPAEQGVVVVDMSRDGLLAVAVRPSAADREAGDADEEGDAGDG